MAEKGFATKWPVDILDRFIDIANSIVHTKYLEELSQPAFYDLEAVYEKLC